MYLDSDDLFLRALLPGSNVSSSRLGADMPRHENHHTQTESHTRTHARKHSVCLWAERKYMCILDTVFSTSEGRFDTSYIFT